jgi:hypothetical protein
MVNKIERQKRSPLTAVVQIQTHADADKSKFLTSKGPPQSLRGWPALGPHEMASSTQFLKTTSEVET